MDPFENVLSYSRIDTRNVMIREPMHWDGYKIATDGHIVIGRKQDDAASLPDVYPDMVESLLACGYDESIALSLNEARKFSNWIGGPRQTGSECSACDGTGEGDEGSATCYACDQEIRGDCFQCAGRGKTDDRYPHRAGWINGRLFDCKLVAVGLSLADGAKIRVEFMSPAGGYQPMRVAGDGWFMIVMGLRGNCREGLGAPRFEVAA